MKGLLQKLLPLDRIIALAARFGLLKKPMELAVKAWTGAQGIRTQGCIVLAVLLALAASLGYIQWAQADSLIQVLAGIAGASFLEKINNVLPTVKSISEKVAEEANKMV